MQLAPEAAWAGSALLRHQSGSNDWEGALKTLGVNRWSNKLSKAENNRLKAVLQTAQAMKLEDQAPDQARNLALSAHKLAPELVPAVVIAARISSRLGDFKKASKLLESTWKLEPHPEIADAYVHVRSGDSAADRLKRANLLASKRPNHVEGQFAIADAAIDAKDWDAARTALAAVLRNSPTERACLLMADIEEAEHGDRGRMRDWLSRAVRAPRDPAWTADSYISENWAPISPISGKLDAFEWKVPVEMLGSPGDVVDYSNLATEPLPEEATPVVPVIAATVAVADKVIDLGSEAEPGKSDNDVSADISKDETAEEPVDNKPETGGVVDEPATDGSDDDEKALEAVKLDTSANESEKPDEPVGDTDTAANANGSSINQSSLLEDKPIIPDDPGVSEQEADEPKSGRFKLF